MNIDHHLQQAIVEILKSSEQPVRYTDLKDPTIENSLFSYHLNKLLTRGMVQKIDNGYLLTVEGARWLNDIGSSIQENDVPRIAVALVVQNEDGEYLIGQRTGQLKVMINDYVTPSLRYSNDEDLPDQIDAVIDVFIPAGRLAERADFGFVLIKPTYSDEKVMRSLFHVTYCQTDVFEPSKANFVWMSREQINAIDHPSARILQGLIEHTGDIKNSYVTPVIVG